MASCTHVLILCSSNRSNLWQSPQVPGHFYEMPTLPALTIIANAMRLLHLGFGGGHGSVMTVLSHVLKYKCLPRFGATLVISVQKKGPQQFEVSVADVSTGQCCLEGSFGVEFSHVLP